MTFVLFSFLYGTRYLFICTKYVALRAALESTVRGAVAPQTSSSSLLLFLFFWYYFSKCTANYPPLRAPGSRRITQRNSGTFASLSSVVKASSFYVRMLFIFFFFLSLSLLHLVLFIYFFVLFFLVARFPR